MLPLNFGFYTLIVEYDTEFKSGDVLTDLVNKFINAVHSRKEQKMC